MPPDEKRKQVDAWFEKAARDLLAAQRPTGGRPFYCFCSFHAQQAAEKAIKLSAASRSALQKNSRNSRARWAVISVAPQLEALLMEACNSVSTPSRLGILVIHRSQNQEAQDAIALARKVYQALFGLLA